MRSSRQRLNCDNSPYRVDAASWFGLRDVVILTAAAIAGFLWLGRDLPLVPLATPDTASYLQFSPIRPHGYSWLLAGYRCMFEDFAYLLHVQLGLFVAALLLLAIAIAKRIRSVALSVTMLLLIIAGLEATDFIELMSDPAYAAALTAAIACFIFFLGALRTIFLLLAGTLLGLAVAFRAVGIAVIPPFLIVVAVVCVGRGRRAVTTLALAALPIVVILLAATLSQLAVNHHFTIGSWGGMDVLGKLPLLPRSAPADSEFARLNGIIEMMEPARQKLAQLKPMTQALVSRQYYEYLRWRVIRPELERRWGEWRNSDEYKRGLLAAGIAKSYIAQNLTGFFHRSAIDLMGLWIMPRWLTPAEHAAKIAELEGVGELPLLSEFSRTPEGEDDFYKIVPDPTGLTKIILFRSVVLAFWMLSLGITGLIVVRPLSTIRVVPDLVLIVTLVHAVYVATALMEGVHERYVAATWPLLVAGPILALGLVRRSWKVRAGPVVRRGKGWQRPKRGIFRPPRRSPPG